MDKKSFPNYLTANQLTELEERKQQQTVQPFLSIHNKKEEVPFYHERFVEDHSVTETFRSKQKKKSTSTYIHDEFQKHHSFVPKELPSVSIAATKEPAVAYEVLKRKLQLKKEDVLLFESEETLLVQQEEKTHLPMKKREKRVLKPSQELGYQETLIDAAQIEKLHSKPRRAMKRSLSQLMKQEQRHTTLPYSDLERKKDLCE